MSRIEKIKRVVLIVLGLSLSAYFIYSGFILLSQEESASKVHSNAVK